MFTLQTIHLNESLQKDFFHPCILRRETSISRDSRQEIPYVPALAK